MLFHQILDNSGRIIGIDDGDYHFHHDRLPP
jgi:hypothetical protein